MDSIITVYTTDDVMQTFKKAGYSPFYHGMNYSDMEWFGMNFKSPHRFFKIIGDEFEVAEIDDIIGDDIRNFADFSISFNQDEVVTFDDWLYITNYLQELFFVAKNTTFSVRGENILKRPLVIDIDADDEYEIVEFKKDVGKWDVSASPDSKPMELIDGVVVSLKPDLKPVGAYFLDTRYIDYLDIKVYQVTKPECLPFTIVVRDWSRKGDKYFFSDIYGSLDWDKNRTSDRFDFPFLQETWRGMLPGEFTMDVVKDRIEECTPRVGHLPEAEPEIYRVGLDDVVERLKNDLACAHKEFIKS